MTATVRPLTADERRAAVRAVQHLAATPAGLRHAAAFARTTLRLGDLLCAGAITRAEFVQRQEVALLACLEGVAAP